MYDTRAGHILAVNKTKGTLVLHVNSMPVATTANEEGYGFTNLVMAQTTDPLGVTISKQDLTATCCHKLHDSHMA
jgi:hypothetical protein